MGRGELFQGRICASPLGLLARGQGLAHCESAVHAGTHCSFSEYPINYDRSLPDALLPQVDQSTEIAHQPAFVFPVEFSGTLYLIKNRLLITFTA